MKNNITNFEIDKNTPIIIYGAAGAGLRGYHSLKTLNGYNVVGFIDQRANEIKQQCDLPVWNVESDLPYKKKDILIVICVKNVFEHDKIAYRLIENGLKNIVFKPIRIMKSLNTIDNNYNKIFNDAKPNMIYQLEPIPILDYIEIYNYLDYAMISRNDSTNTVITNIPLSEIYIKSWNEINFLNNKHRLCNVMALVPHISFFSLLDGSNGDIGTYLKFCISTIKNSRKTYGDGGNIEVTDAWCNNIIRNRRVVFDNMNINMEIDDKFFIENAPSCYLCENYLVMQSAKHRAAFYIVKRKRYMPIEISIDDYEILLNKPILEKLIDFLTDNKIYELNTPVQHPFMYKYPSKMSNYYELFISNLIFSVAEILENEHDLNKITVENSIHDDGALSRYLSKIGFKVKTICEDGIELQLNRILQNLFYIDEIYYSNTFESADIICIQTNEIEKATNIDAAKILVILGEPGFILKNNKFELKSKLFKTIWKNQSTVGYLYLRKDFAYKIGLH